jgi:hypothetical protein
MNMSVALEIVQLALTLAQIQDGGDVHPDETLGEILSDIVRTAAQAYHDHMGEPIDPSLIEAEEPV